MKKLILSTLTAAVVISGMSSSFAAPKQKVQEPISFTLATGQEPTRGSAGTCNWGGYYANNECVWHDIENDGGGSYTQCKVCKNGRWYDLYRCERRCFK
jgi:hypothetical protein